MVKLTPEQQGMLCTTEPAMFAPVKGDWGRQESTKLFLAFVDSVTLHSALAIAWRNAAPKALAATLEPEAD